MRRIESEGKDYKDASLEKLKSFQNYVGDRVLVEFTSDSKFDFSSEDALEKILENGFGPELLSLLCSRANFARLVWQKTKEDLSLAEEVFLNLFDVTEEPVMA
ncbi:MAG: hypothetical protein N4A44_04370 [Alphaproteobacteria bacterium]|jgi:hypothetical protein|nr:hypothetical protein [Alphaproteobacteria bacterium]